MRYSIEGLESNNPIDVLWVSGGNSIISVDGCNIPWKIYAFSALCEAHRIELFHNVGLAPLEIDPIILGFLKNERYSSLEVENRLMDLRGNIFYRYVWDLHSGIHYGSGIKLLRLFFEKKRDNSALDLHLRACKYYLLRHTWGLDRIVNHYNNHLVNDPIQRYFMRVVLNCRSEDRRELMQVHGWKLHERLG